MTRCLSGANFGTSGIFSIGGKSCVSQFQSHTKIVCTLPVGTGLNLPVVVNITGQLATASTRFSYDSPRLSVISPNNGISSGGCDRLTCALSFRASHVA